MSIVNGPDTQLLGRLLEATQIRAKAISSNIANQNTPGYTRQVVRFEELLREAVQRDPSAISRIQPEVLHDTVTPARPDGNNVVLELELNEMRENRLMFETYAAILAGHFNMLDSAITESR